MTNTAIVFRNLFGMKSWFALVLIFLVHSLVHASGNSKKLKLRKFYNTKGRQESRNNDRKSRIGQKDVWKSIAKHSVNAYNKHGTVAQAKLKQNQDGSINSKLKLKSKLTTKKHALSSTKRQNVLTGNPDQQRLFHVDETGTLHRHEVGPEEYTTPEGKTETFSNDRLLTEENLVNLRPSQTAVMDPSTRQMTPPPLPLPKEQGSSSLPVVQPGSPVAFVAPNSLPQTPPKRYYLMTYRKPSDPNSPNLAPRAQPGRLPRLQRVYINRLPVGGFSNNPVPYQLPYPSIVNQNPMPFPIPIANPPRIKNVPYPVPVPVQSPPQIQIQKVPVAVPQPIPVPQIRRVPVPVPVQSPPQIRIQKVPVPFPQPVPFAQPVPVPHPIPYQPMRGIIRQRPIIPVPVGLSECETSPCRNGGTCYSVDDIQSYRCHCASGFKGAHCEDTSKCHPNPCENLGECTVLQSGYECSCKKGFRGTRCEVRDKCHPSPCKNGGSCTSVGNEYACSCIFGFIGKDCEVESKCFPLNPCKHGGVCHEDIGSYKCTCTAGWTGISCEIPDPCSRNPCYHGGVCRGLGTSFTCSCPMGYLGKTCQIESQCHASNPCHNGGTCWEHDLDGYRCYCNRRWTGEHCEIPSHTSYY